MDVGFSGSLNNLCHRNLSGVIPVRYVLGNTAVKQYRFLRYYSDLSPQPLDVQILNVVTVQILQKKALTDICNYAKKYESI